MSMPVGLLTDADPLQPAPGMTAISLFSGCGGSDIGAKHAGVDVIFANDDHPATARTYKRFKKLIASDETEFRDCDVADIKSFPSCDLVLGCYPCQSFTMGGPRRPETDSRTRLYHEFARCLRIAKPKFFVAENVAGLKWLDDGKYLQAQLETFGGSGPGYRVSVQLLDAKEYGVPADRRRIFMVGVRRDLGLWYQFPDPTHGPGSPRKRPYASHGKRLMRLRPPSDQDYYHQGADPFSWWYMSRNRKRPWTAPSYTILANWRHVPLHPASPLMRLVESDLKRKSWQRWEFTKKHDVPAGSLMLRNPRRLSWRECESLQTLPLELEPEGTVEQKYWQIGNAVPPLLMQRIVEPLVTESGLSEEAPAPVQRAGGSRPVAP
jgi:DNA (cytosine-5)-methyltransferase 1